MHCTINGRFDLRHKLLCQNSAFATQQPVLVKNLLRSAGSGFKSLFRQREEKSFGFLVVPLQTRCILQGFAKNGAASVVIQFLALLKSFLLFSLHSVKTVLEFKASLITASQLTQVGKFLKNIQPISVGVWKRLPSSLELVHSTTNAHESKEVKFTSILDFMSSVARRKKTQDRTEEFDPGSD